jgi:opacity protein-like surface antigen
MRNLVLTLFTAAAAMTVTQAASAADLPRSRAVAAPVVASVSTWTGCYIGANLVWAHFDQTITQAGVQVGQFSNTKGGYAVGGGWEYKFAPNWSAFVEYNYMDFGTSSGTTTNGVNVNLKRDMQTVLVGVNWRFGSPWGR